MNKCRKCKGTGRIIKYENLERSTIGGGYHMNWDLGSPPRMYYAYCDCKVRNRPDEELVSKASGC